jgi:hypothetical protein
MISQTINKVGPCVTLDLYAFLNAPVFVEAAALHLKTGAESLLPRLHLQGRTGRKGGRLAPRIRSLAGELGGGAWLPEFAKTNVRRGAPPLVDETELESRLFPVRPCNAGKMLMQMAKQGFRRHNDSERKTCNQSRPPLLWCAAVVTVTQPPTLSISPVSGSSSHSSYSSASES